MTCFLWWLEILGNVKPVLSELLDRIKAEAVTKSEITPVIWLSFIPSFLSFLHNVVAWIPGFSVAFSEEEDKIVWCKTKTTEKGVPMAKLTQRIKEIIEKQETIVLATATKKV